MSAEAIDLFWTAARHQLRINPVPGYLGTYSGEVLAPPAWSFGATPEVADELLELVLDGTKTATASALWDYEAPGPDGSPERVPQAGDLSIVLDGEGHPRALIETTRVDVTPFDQVDEEHARLEGEGDRTLASWREGHQRYFTEHAAHHHGFEPTMPVVLERFRLLYPV